MKTIEIDEYIEKITKLADQKVEESFNETSLTINPEKPFENFELAINRLALRAAIAETIASQAGLENELNELYDLFEVRTRVNCE